MAGIHRALTACLAALFFIAGPLTTPRAAAQEPAQASGFMKPVPQEGEVFPVLLPMDGRWLNWRDTYGAPRMRLIGGVWKQVGVHQGIDIFAERGSPVVSLGPGVVENAGWTFYSGWRVGVRGTDGRYYFYAHLLKNLAQGIAPGARVSSGQLLGYLGSSGYGPEGTSEEFPPHLHFGLQERSGRWANPQEMLESLYQSAISRLYEARRSSGAAELRAEVLRSRAYSPGAPPRQELAKSIGEATSERDSVLAAVRLS